MVEIIKTNQHLLLRNGELFHRKRGFGFFNERTQNMGGANVIEEPSIWLPRETEDLAIQVESGQSVMIEGDPGAGKSALVYGLRSLWRQSGLPYCYFDGHFSATSSIHIDSSFLWAIRYNAVVIFDSTDYLVASKKCVRRLPRYIHEQKTSRVFSMIDSFLNQGGIFVGTTHSPPWLQRFADPYLVETHLIPLMARMSTHKVHGRFDQPEEALRFYQCAGFDDKAALYLSMLPNSQKLRAVINSNESCLQALPSYRIAKLFCLDQSSSSKQIRYDFSLLLSGQITEQEFFHHYADYVAEKNQETRKKMGL